MQPNRHLFTSALGLISKGATSERIFWDWNAAPNVGAMLIKDLGVNRETQKKTEDVSRETEGRLLLLRYGSSLSVGIAESPEKPEAGWKSFEESPSLHFSNRSAASEALVHSQERRGLSCVQRRGVGESTRRGLLRLRHARSRLECFRFPMEISWGSEQNTNSPL